MMTPNRWMRHRATITPWVEQGVSGPVYGKHFQCKCRLSLGTKLTWRQSESNAQEIVAAGKAYFPAATSIHPQDRIEISGRRFMALAVQPRYDWNGAENHVEVTLQ